LAESVAKVFGAVLSEDCLIVCYRDLLSTLLHKILVWFGRSNWRAIISWSQQTNWSSDWGTIRKITRMDIHLL